MDDEGEFWFDKVNELASYVDATSINVMDPTACPTCLRNEYIVMVTLHKCPPRVPGPDEGY